MFVVYEVLLFLVLVAALPWFLFVGLLRGKYLLNLRERLGFHSVNPSRHDVWIHAVSVGEVLVARPVVEAILQQRPGTSFVVTTTTVTGQRLARQQFPSATVTWFPFDFGWSIRRFLASFGPSMLVIVETEIWPNVVRIARREGLRLVMCNGRLSDRSYPRYRAFRWLLRPVLSRFDQIVVREEQDRDRFLAIGAPEERVSVAGNVKFDLPFQQQPLEFASHLDRLATGRPVMVAGSTVEGEDEILLPAIRQLVSEGFFVIVAPRKPERFEIVGALLEAGELRLVRRSRLDESADLRGDVLLLDSIGELSRVYARATAAFVGGSLVRHGGHNPIEPAAAGTPVSFGPEMSNFREIAKSFLEDGAAREVCSADELVAFAREMRSDPESRSRMVERSQDVVSKNRGAAARIARAIVERLDR